MKMGQRRPRKKVQGNHGAKRDYFETRLRGYKDKNSFVSLDGREFLCGLDWENRKLELAARDKGSCHWNMCGKPSRHPHHMKPKGKGGDDSLANLILVCEEHHKEAHPEKQVRLKSVPA
jgi:hypothetical protein